MRQNENCIAVYSRKSKFTGKGESIGNQVELCKEYIRLHFGEESVRTIRVYEDEGFSGGNLNRPGFKQMMKDAKDGRFNTIMVYRLDRISRNLSDFTTLIEDLNRMNVGFISLKEQFDTCSPMGRAMMYITSVFSQLERETIAERIRDNMHELAKTGRWLGGMTPTGYESESVKSVTVDGKVKKACKLKLIPEEAELVRKIFDLFLESNSLTMTEAELLRQRIKSKNGRDFTRFSIKGILQNPVYLIADQDAYDYFVEKQTDLFSELSEFDGVHGVLAYNRTDQEKGRATVYLPPNEWIVSVGKHPGIIPAKEWIKVQETLERNRSKGYRKPKSNEALLTGLLFCRCGNRMYPKLTKRLTEEGEPVYTYVCKMKERSKKELCKCRNVNGNLLDRVIIEEIKGLSENKDEFVSQLEKSRRFYTGDREQYEKKLSDLKENQATIEKKILALVDSLADLGDGVARGHVTKRIEDLHKEQEMISSRIMELEGLTAQHALSDVEFELMKQLLSLFSSSLDTMSVHEKRAAIRTVVRKVAWDGTHAHVYLFGAPEGDAQLPPVPVLSDKKDEDEEVEKNGENEVISEHNNLFGEDSKRDTDVLSGTEKIAGRSIFN